MVVQANQSRVMSNVRAAMPPPPPPQQTRAQVSFGKIDQPAGHRTVIYGPGGSGKTTSAAKCGKVAFFDLDESLARLRPEGDILPVNWGETWADLRSTLQMDGWDGIGAIVIDTLTKAEELCVAHTIATIPHEKGHRVQRLEDYGFGKGYTHVYDTFLPILSDLDRHCRAGRHVILICHDCTSTVPNPNGEDWLRYEPRLQNPGSGKASIRLRVREWADHLLFLGYDVDVKNGKGKGSGTRTIYPMELPHCMAKSRTCQQPFPLIDGSEVWKNIIGGK